MLDDFLNFLPLFGGIVVSTFVAGPPLLAIFLHGSWTQHGAPMDEQVLGQTCQQFFNINVARSWGSPQFEITISGFVQSKFFLRHIFFILESKLFF